MSEHDVGSRGWKEDVRNYIAGKATPANELVPPVSHLVPHCKRASFISRMYWSNSSMDDLSLREVGGTSEKYGYVSDGTIIVEEPHDIVNVENRIRAVILSCRCKGKCSSRLCSCLNRGQHCVDCECNDVLCSNWIEQEEDAPKTANDKCAGVRKETVSLIYPLRQQWTK